VSLDSKWNLRGTDAATLAAAVSLISDMSGWPDPFLGGVEHLDHWVEVMPTRNALSLKAITRTSENRLRAHLACAREAVHVNFSNFKERGTALGWMVPDVRPAVEVLLGSAPDGVATDDAAPAEGTDGATG
jgi:hypothetical protein